MFWLIVLCFIAQRLHDLEVRVISSNPKEEALVVSSNKVCGVFQGQVGSGATAEIKCNPHIVGRYVMVWLKEAGILTICELEVFGYEVKLPVVNGKEMDNLWLYFNQYKSFKGIA